MKITIENIMKVADVHTTSISEEVQQFLLNECSETYRYMRLTENMYDVSDILESINDPKAGYFSGDEPSETVKFELEKINKKLSSPTQI